MVKPWGIGRCERGERQREASRLPAPRGRENRIARRIGRIGRIRVHHPQEPVKAVKIGKGFAGKDYLIIFGSGRGASGFSSWVAALQFSLSRFMFCAATGKDKAYGMDGRQPFGGPRRIRRLSHCRLRHPRQSAPQGRITRQ